MDDRIRTALSQVIDPDLGINIVDLGLVESIEPSEGGVSVGLVMTSPVCPQAPFIADQCADTLAALGIAASVRILDQPEWQPERMSDMARSALGWDR